MPCIALPLIYLVKNYLRQKSERFFLVIGRLLFLVTSIVFLPIGLLVLFPVTIRRAAYTRIKEYYDFYAVPLRLISRALPQAFTQMTDYVTSATSDSRNTDILKDVPYSNLSDISSYFDRIYNKDYFDDVSLPLAYSSAKLLDMLGYGSFMSKSAVSLPHVTGAYFGQSITSPTDNPLVYAVSQRVNILPILAIVTGKNIWLMLIMSIIGLVILLLFLLRICLNSVMRIILRTTLWVFFLVPSMVR